MTVETLSVLGTVSKDTGRNQAQVPSNLTVTYAGDDADNHDVKFEGRGKGRGSIVVHNKTDQTATVSLYGMHVVTEDVGGDSVVQIGSSFTVAATVVGYETFNDPFPFYLVRVVLGGGPDGSNVILNINLAAY